MQVILDTSSLIRFFTKDIPERAVKVKALLEDDRNIFIPDVVFPELEYILINQYKIQKKQIVKFFQFLTSRKNIKVTAQTRHATRIFEKTNLDMADSIIAAYSFKGEIASFDRELLKTSGIHPHWK